MDYAILGPATATTLDKRSSRYSAAREEITLRDEDTLADTIHAIHDVPGFRVLQPIPFRLEKICGEIVVTDEVFLRYGVGGSLNIARTELADALADYFVTLRREEARLSAGARQHLGRMREYVAV